MGKKADFQLSFDVTSADYIVGKTDRVIVDAIKTVQSHDIIQMVSGIKDAGVVPDLQAGATNFKGGDFTGVNDGSISIADVSVANSLVTLEEKYSAIQISSTILKLAQKQGVDPTDIAISDVILELKGNAIAIQYDLAIWQGDKTKTDKSVGQFVDGFVKKLKASTSTLLSGVAPVALTNSNAVATISTLLESYFTTLPKMTMEKISLYMSPSDFRILYAATYGLNGIINSQTLNEGKLPEMFTHPLYANVNIVSTKGLVGLHEYIVSRPDNLLEVVDGNAERDFIKFYFEDRDEAFLLHIAFRLGVQVARFNEVMIQKVAV